MLFSNLQASFFILHSIFKLIECSSLIFEDYFWVYHSLLARTYFDYCYLNLHSLSSWSIQANTTLNENCDFEKSYFFIKRYLLLLKSIISFLKDKIINKCTWLRMLQIISEVGYSRTQFALLIDLSLFQILFEDSFGGFPVSQKQRYGWFFTL